MSQPHHLSVGFAGGGLSSLLLQLLRDWHAASPVIPVNVDSERFDCRCSVFINWDLTEKELAILLCGILIGILLLPVIELLLVLRQAWSYWIRSRLLGASYKSSSLYRRVDA